MQWKKINRFGQTRGVMLSEIKVQEERGFLAQIL